MLKIKILKKSVHFFLSIIFLTCLMYCTSSKDENVVVFHKKFEIETSRFIGEFHQYIFDQDTFLFDASSEKNIYQRDLSWNIIDSIDVDFYPHQWIQDFHFISKDSILLVFFTNIFNEYHDDAMIIVDRNKNILETINLSNLPILMKPKFNVNNKETNRDYFLNYWTDFPLTYDKGRIVAPLSLYSSKKIEYPEKLQPNKIVHHYQNDSVSETPIKFSFLKDHKSYCNIYQKPIGTFHNSTLYAAYGYEPVIYKYNIDNHSFNKKYISFETMDTIYPSLVKDFFDLRNEHLFSRYNRICYDSTNQTIILFAQLGADSTESPLSRQNPIKTFVILDTSLNKLAEGIMPNQYDNRFNLIPYNGGFLIFKEEKKDGTVVYDYLNYTIEKKKSGFLKQEIQKIKNKYNKGFVKKPENEMILSYIEHLTQQKMNDAKILIIPIESTCTGFITGFSNAIQKNFEKLQDKSLFVILVSDKNVANPFIDIDGFIAQSIPKDYKSDSSSYKQLFYIDSTKIFFSYTDGWINPKYVECQSSKIVFNKNIDPNDFKLFTEKINR